MKFEKRLIPLFIVNFITLAIFTVVYAAKANFEFLLYIGVIIFFVFLIIWTNKKVKYSTSILWGLSIWAIMHMAGGSLMINGKVLYQLILLPISEQYHIFRFDQFVHIFGFGVATLLMFHLIEPLLKPDIKRKALSIVIVMAGFGVGALNEVIEFTAVVLMPETGVGGYNNTLLDLVADLIGAIIAMFIINFAHSREAITFQANKAR